MIIPDTFNKKYIETDKLPQYHKKMARAYTDTSKSLRWCPAVNCQYGADLLSFRARAVECRCGWVYCFKCGQEDHTPCPCDVAKEWNKNGANKDVLLCRMWVIANTKDCPKCKKPIEKNQGCNHMTCRNLGCMYEFCWICLQKWGSAHDSYLCNQYQQVNYHFFVVSHIIFRKERKW
jgi:ariadne-1